MNLERIDLIADILSDAFGTGAPIAVFKEDYDALPEEERAPTFEEEEGYIDPSLFPSYLSFVNALNDIIDANGEELEALRERLGDDLEEALDFFLAFPPA